MSAYRLTLKHDNGTVRLTTSASSADAAIDVIMKAEGCPRSAIAYVENLDTCPVCGRRNSWGCGHDGSQRANARRHNATRKHLDERCFHFTDPPRDGWLPAEHSSTFVRTDDHDKGCYQCFWSLYA